jgi:D-serine deaminase-like pyridoxal phosphate-dependent protein
MTTRPPAEIGMPLDEVDTPALVIDLDAFERNLRRLSDRIAASPVRARPHAKTHKCPVIALKQVELGAVGVCVQKVSEAEAMVYGGVRDVLVTNEVVGPQKLRRLASLAQTARVGVCADDESQVRALEAAAGDAGITLPVYVEVNMGGNRCGVEPGEPALQLATLIADAPHLAFAGLQAYHGSAQHLRGWDERRQWFRELAPKPRGMSPAKLRVGGTQKRGSDSDCADLIIGSMFPAARWRHVLSMQDAPQNESKP